MAAPKKADEKQQVRKKMQPHCMIESQNLSTLLRGANPPETPLLYLAVEQSKVILRGKGIPKGKLLDFFVQAAQQNPEIPGYWVSHGIVSKACGFTSEYIDAAIMKYGHGWGWAPEFANCHATFKYQEKGFTTADGIKWSGPEALYQSYKLKPLVRFDVKRLRRVARMTDMEAHRWGSELKEKDFIGAEQWDGMKTGIMRRCIAYKFDADDDLRNLLLQSAPLTLVNLKDDRFWGFPGQNMLGILIQEYRDAQLK